MFLSKYGEARVIEIPIVKRAVVDFALGADWTPAAGDVTITKDGGAAANVTNLPTALAMGNTALWSFSLTATEMQAARVVVTVADAATKVVEDQAFVIETYGHASAQHAFDFDTASSAQTGDNFARLGAPAGASVSADIAGVQSDTNDIQTRLPAALTGAGNIKADALAVSDKTGYSLGAGGIPVGAFAAGAITDAASAADFETAIRDALWAKALEGTLTAEQIVRILLSALAGVTASGGAVLKTPDGLTTRITATLNASNERTAMVLTP